MPASVGPCRVRAITFDCADPYELAGFWSAVTGLSRDEDDKPGDDEVALLPPDREPPWWLFIRVPEGKTAKNRVHLDLTPMARTRDEEVEALLAIGATLADDQRRPDGRGWVVMRDPEGNEFCVERSEAERGTESH